MASGRKQAEKSTDKRSEKKGSEKKRGRDKTKAHRKALRLLAGAAEPPLPPEPPTRPGRPPGQRLYDMPFSSPAPRLIKPELGLHNLVARAGHNAAYTIDVTLLDAPDHRLIRSGVLLAHRVLDGRGEWFLTAPEWQPLLPKDRIELMGHSDLPDELASLIRPLRRRATLGPVAGLNCERREFALRDDAGTTLALLRDDKVTVRRGGLTTARYREIMLTPVGPGLTDDQRAAIDRAFLNVGANRVPRFPRLTARLGAPATGPSDIPAEEAYEPAVPFRRFVTAVIGNHLREIVRCDLAMRGGDTEAVARLGFEAAALRDDLAGLAAGLEPATADDLRDDLDWLVGAAADTGRRLSSGSGPTQLRSERYLSVLEHLVAAARSPRLAVDGAEPAAIVLARLLEGRTARLRHDADALRADSSDPAWEQVRRDVDDLRLLAAVATPLLPEEAAAATRLLHRPGPLLDAVRLGDETPPPALDGMDAAAAFAAGRAYERSRQLDRRARQDFVERWAKAVRKLGS